MTMRLVLAAVLLAAAQGAVLWIRHGREPDEIRDPSRSLADLPVRLGTWHGRDEAMDPRLGVAIGAKPSNVVNRMYEDETGRRVAMQLAAFTSNDVEPPHSPLICYPQVGWAILERKMVELRVGPEATRPARLLVMEQEGQRILVMYWYQVGDANVFDSADLRRARWSLFGQKVWPPVIKVMLQVSLRDAVQTENQLHTFAELVLNWTKDVE